MMPMRKWKCYIKSWPVKSFAIPHHPALTSPPAMQMDQDKLRTENISLVTAFREKSRKHQQIQELYDRLKRKEMTSATQSAAYNSVDDVLGSVSHHRAQQQANIPHQFQTVPGAEDGPGIFPQIPADYDEIAQPNSHSIGGSNGSHEDSRRMPPPSYRAKRNEAKGTDIGIFDDS